MGLLAIFCTVNGDCRLPAALLRLALAESTAFLVLPTRVAAQDDRGWPRPPTLYKFGSSLSEIIPAGKAPPL